ncbi:hypothetical protein EVAR_84266_1 [Eumeta japonica]|uniref:Uncharacterized protein n=1 Tax=Eumeta variegata TaxID=151549 RepID=A0A4C1WT78_EUMVA|nr:hypothetical protein EVAR_84266_1 [Eumeta japonica]
MSTSEVRLVIRPCRLSASGGGQRSSSPVQWSRPGPPAQCGWRPPTLVVTGAMVTSGTAGSVRVATADARRHRRNGNVRDRRLSAGGDRRRSSSPAQW